VPELPSRSDLRLVRIAAIGALVAAALGLAGCGRKAGLDPPPATLADQGAAVQPGAGPDIGPDGRPIAPAPLPPPRRSTPIDWLLN
jgi:predicted small lipoprotein YifL